MPRRYTTDGHTIWVKSILLSVGLAMITQSIYTWSEASNEALILEGRLTAGILIP